jgi:hypothetical protein
MSGKVGRLEIVRIGDFQTRNDLRLDDRQTVAECCLGNQNYMEAIHRLARLVSEDCSDFAIRVREKFVKHHRKSLMEWSHKIEFNFNELMNFARRFVSEELNRKLQVIITVEISQNITRSRASGSLRIRSSMVDRGIPTDRIQ